MPISGSQNNYGRPGARLAKGYDITIRRYRKSHTEIKVPHAYYAMYGLKIWCEKFLNPYAAKY